jgi:pimeloyl-ACP methyl ester carboxylesterase
MLTFDRLAFERGGTAPAEVHDKLLAHARFLERYLLDGEDPGAIAAADPRLAGVWKEMRGTDEGAHYWRPYAYHRQAAARNFLAAWAAIDAPVLVLHAQHDQFEAEAGHRLIAEAVNRLRPGTATFLSIANLGHDFAVYPSPEAAMRWESGVTAAELVIEPIVQWLRARGLAKP